MPKSLYPTAQVPLHSTPQENNTILNTIREGGLKQTINAAYSFRRYLPDAEIFGLS
jgi:hypothetical protein